MARILIKSGIVVTMDRALGDFPQGDVLVEGETIAAVGAAIEASDAEVIDARQRIVMPGFVNSHMHTWQTPLRGVAADWTIGAYLHHMHATLAPRFQPEDVFIGNLVGALGQLAGGVTTLVDWCHNMWAAASCARPTASAA